MTAGSVRMGAVAVVGPHIVDILGRPVTEIPAGQGSVVLDEIRITVAGTGGGAAVDLAKLGCAVSSFAAVGDDLLGRLMDSQLQAHGVDTTGLVWRRGEVTSATILPIRPNGERPALHVPGATPSLSAADVDGSALLAADAVLFEARKPLRCFSIRTAWHYWRPFTLRASRSSSISCIRRRRRHSRHSARSYR